MKARSRRSVVVRAALVAVCLVAATAGVASARWSVHDAHTGTEIAPLPGVADDEVCRDQVRGLTGWVDTVSEGEDPATHPLPNAAFTEVTYQVYKAPPGSSLSVDSTDGEHFFVGYHDEAGVLQRATFLTSFTTTPRTRPPAPIARDSTSTSFVFTTAPFSVPIDSVQPGDRIGLKPGPMHPTVTVLGLTAVDCGDSGFVPRWEGDPGLCRMAQGRFVLSDVNGNGRVDMVCQSPRSGALKVGLAGPGGQFAQTDWQGTLGACGRGSRLLSDDVDGDGRADLVCHTQATGVTEVALARSSGRFPRVDWNGSAGLCRRTGTRLLLGDVNGDFRADLVCQDPATGEVAVARARTGGRFPAVDTRDLPGMCTAAGTQLRLDDVTSDGRADLVCQNTTTGHVWLSLAKAGAPFPDTDWERNLGFCAGSPGWFQVADVSGDGRSDLVCHDPATGHVAAAYSDR